MRSARPCVAASHQPGRARPIAAAAASRAAARRETGRNRSHRCPTSAPARSLPAPRASPARRESAAGGAPPAPPDGWRRRAAMPGRLPARGAAARPARHALADRLQGAEDRSGRERQVRIDQQHRKRRQPVPGLDLLADAAHPRRASRKADRHVGAEPGGEGRQIGRRHAEAPQPVQAAQHRRGIGRAAAQACRDRQPLVERDPHRRRAACAWPQAALPRAAPDCRARPRAGPRTARKARAPGDHAHAAPRGRRRRRTRSGCRARDSRRRAGR